MERRIVAQLLTCLDDLAAGPSAGEQDGGEPGGGGDAGDGGVGMRPHPHVVVIGATNRPDALDTALRCVCVCAIG